MTDDQLAGLALVEAMSDTVTAAHDALMKGRRKAEADALTDAWEAVRTTLLIEYTGA